MNAAEFESLNVLATAVVIVRAGHIVSLNSAAEDLLGISARQCRGLDIEECLPSNPELRQAIEHVREIRASFTEHDLKLNLHGVEFEAGYTVSPLDDAEDGVVIEFHPTGRSARIERDERIRHQTQASRELLRNLAHEIKNPLGGIRGAAQLLESELPRAELHEYTRVIIQEADRLQALLDRLLTPQRRMVVASFNIHEVLERVRSVVLAETPEGIVIRRDYDTSLPELTADAQQVIQSVLNIVRNAVQAMEGSGEIFLRTRVARQVNIALKRHRLAAQIEIVDNGPGIPEDLRERIFFPLVSGREGGTGLGLSLAQTYVHQNGGAIEVESHPGWTCFRLLFPLSNSPVRGEAPQPEIIP